MLYILFDEAIFGLQTEFYYKHDFNERHFLKKNSRAKLPTTLTTFVYTFFTL